MLFGIHGIEESTVYQGILRKGEQRPNQAALMTRGRSYSNKGVRSWGRPSERIEAEIAALDDVDRLHDLIDRVLDVSTWDELMASPDR